MPLGLVSVPGEYEITLLQSGWHLQWVILTPIMSTTRGTCEVVGKRVTQKYDSRTMILAWHVQ
jgi:hypothetical protein